MVCAYVCDVVDARNRCALPALQYPGGAVPLCAFLLVESDRGPCVLVTIRVRLGSCWRMQSLSGGDIPHWVRSATCSSLIGRGSRSDVSLSHSLTHSLKASPLRCHFPLLSLTQVHHREFGVHLCLQRECRAFSPSRFPVGLSFCQ
jgi:hypothetical protein